MGGAVIQENPPPQQRFITLAPRWLTLNPLYFLAPPPCSSPPYPPPRHLGLPSIPADPRTKLQRDCGVGEGWPCSSQVQACLIPRPPTPQLQQPLGNSSFLLRRPHKPFWGGDPELGLGFECSRDDFKGRWVGLAPGHRCHSGWANLPNQVRACAAPALPPRTSQQKPDSDPTHWRCPKGTGRNPQTGIPEPKHRGSGRLAASPLPNLGHTCPHLCPRSPPIWCGNTWAPGPQGCLDGPELPPVLDSTSRNP